VQQSRVDGDAHAAFSDVAARHPEQ
jgi:hypothetical protein